MGKKSKALEASRTTEAAIRAMVMRREGAPWQEIADRLGCNILEAQELAGVAYAQMAEETAEELRRSVEDRIDAVVRKANLDLSIAESQAARTGLYRVLLAAEAQRSRLLGLNMKGDDDD